MKKPLNLPVAIFFAVHRRLFSVVVNDFSQSIPIPAKGYTLLVLSLLLSQKLRLHPQRRVGLALPPGIAGIIGNIAVLFAGKIPVNLNLTVSRDSIINSMKEAEIKLVISADKVRSKFPDFPWTDEFIDIGDFVNGERAKKINLAFLVLQIFLFPQKIFRKFKLNQISNDRKESVLLFTSGSSNQPKGVVLSDQNILSNCDQMNSLGLFKKGIPILGNLPLFHSFGLTVGTFFPLLYDLLIISSPSPLDYKSSLRAIRKGKAEVILGTPTFLKGYLRKGKHIDFKSVRYVVAGAEKTPLELMKHFEREHGCEYLEGYGLTETSPGLSFNLPGKGRKEGSVGKLMIGIEGRTIDPDSGVPLEDNDSGILCFRGPNIFARYLNNDKKTKEVLSRDGWFITGDLGRIDKDGFLFIEGRLSRFSKIGGEMVSHESVEVLINQVLGGEDNEKPVCVVTGMADKVKGECLILLTTKQVDKKVLADELRNSGLPNLCIPKHIKLIEEVPVLGTGKLDLRKIKDLAEL
ncbi:AMP-binding protein [Opitutales bacterium]|nr:AMP-binding protein [Opitutales bacterium]